MDTIILSPLGIHKKYVIQLSDIHIRTGDLDKSRYNEYEGVFNNLIESVSQIDTLVESVLVITGDIFHHKGKIEPAGIKLAQSLLTSLLGYADVCMICGNHDYRQDNPKIPDMIETIYENYINGTIKTKYRAFYLNKTGYYHYHNIGFAVVDIKDTLKTYNTVGRNDELIAFPPKSGFDEHPHIDYAIALFHGTILPSRLMNNLNIKNGYELEWFDTYSYVMLGDNHRMQWNIDDGKMWGYPGSLIQQDFGETFMEHGYFIWNLVTKRMRFNIVFNDYGYCTIKETKTKLFAFINKKTFIELTNFPTFPKHVSFRVFSKDLIPRVEAFCAAQKVTPTCIIHWTAQDESATEPTAGAIGGATDAIEELNTTEKWFEYLEKHTDIDMIKPFILHPELLKLPMIDETIDFFKKYNERNDKIQKVIDEYLTETTKIHKTAERVSLLNMSWAYLMCYGEANYFDFKSIAQSIALLNGKNAMGKSSFLDIICIALYGEPTKMRHLVNGKKYTDKIIHDQRPSARQSSPPFVKVLLAIGSKTYEIYRSFGSQSSKVREHLIVQTKVQIALVENAEKTVLCEGSTLVDRWIEEHIGSMESILMSIMICQTDLNNFFHLKQDEQKTILDKALRLDTVSLYGRILKEATLAHNDMITQIKTAKQTVEKMFPVDYVSRKEELDTEVFNLEMTIREKEKWRGEILVQLNRIYKPHEIAVNIDFAFDEIQTLYIQTNLYIPVSAEDNNLMIVAREKLRLVEADLKSLSDVEVLDGDEKDLCKWTAKYERFLTKEPKCDVKMEWVKKTLDDYSEWNATKKLDYDLSEIEKRFLEIESQMLNFVKVEKPSVPMPAAAAECGLSEKDYQKKCAKRKVLLDNPLNKNRSLDEYNQWLAGYHRWHDDIKDVIEIDIDAIRDARDELINKIALFNDALKEKSQIEADLHDVKDLDFNSTCWACQKNPFAIKKTILTGRYETLKNQIIQTELISKWEASIVEYDNTIAMHRLYLLKKDDYENAMTYWSEILKSWKVYDKCKKDLDTLTKEIGAYEMHKAYHQHKAYNEQEAIHATLRSTYQASKAIYDSAKKQQYEADEWAAILSDIEKYTDIYNLYEIWEKEHTIVKARLKKYEDSLKKRKLEEVHAIYQTEYDFRKQNADVYQRYEDSKNMYYSNKLHIVDGELAELNRKREIVLNQKAKSDASDEIVKKHKSTFEKLLYLEQTYEERIVKIKQLDVVFMGDKTASDGYKEWIYKTQVIPLINREMNTFLAMFESFAFDMSYEKKHFIYMLEDRGNRPTLDKASGYQNFIIGLAFRIILTRIGCIGQQMKHLFIDEGFTACDASNIEKVPTMLKSILHYGDYESIVLMSHLDSVRECSSIHINIERKDPFSYIYHGKDYPLLTTTCDKARGRPKAASSTN